MSNDIIRTKLEKVKLKYKETNKSFIIPKEKEMSKSKAPEWFQSFEKRWNDKFDEHVAEFKEFKNQQLAFNNLLLSLPTIKKEINELKK